LWGNRDKEAKKLSFFSLLLDGTIMKDPASGKYQVKWGSEKKITSGHNEAGRGMELSELISYNGSVMSSMEGCNCSTARSVIILIIMLLFLCITPTASSMHWMIGLASCLKSRRTLKWCPNGLSWKAMACEYHHQPPPPSQADQQEDMKMEVLVLIVVGNGA